MLVYLAGLYTKGNIDENIAHARAIAIEVWESVCWALTPHLNTAHFEIDCLAGYESYMQGDFRMVTVCDAILMLPGWEQSSGAKRELELAQRLKMPVYYYPDLPKPHPTEVNCPEQARAFLETVMTMYRVHLDKNADYSPANINGAGTVGLSTRILDKVARLMNLAGIAVEANGEYSNLLALYQRVLDLLHLTGFRIRYVFGRFHGVKTPRNEPLNDAYMDIAVYGIIGLLRRQGKWGK
jgi:hypothetical protein